MNDTKLSTGAAQHANVRRQALVHERVSAFVAVTCEPTRLHPQLHSYGVWLWPPSRGMSALLRMRSVNSVAVDGLCRDSGDAGTILENHHVSQILFRCKIQNSKNITSNVVAQ